MNPGTDGETSIREPEPNEADTISETLLRPFYRSEAIHDPDYHALDHEWVADADITRWLEEDDHVIFIAVSDTGEHVGFITGRRSEQPPLFDRDPVLVIDGLYVRPEYRNKGIAADLLDRIEEWARSHGCTHIGLTVHANNPAAIDLYESRDYEFAYRGYHRKL